VRSDKSLAREAITDVDGRFRLAPLSAGLYTVTVRKVGYRSAEQRSVRVPEGQTVSLSVSLTQAPRQLSTIQVVTSPTSINASTPELSLRLDRGVTELLPTARDASSLIALVPLGQNVFVEPRGSRHYASRDIVDLHLEWRSPKFAVLTLDLFNAWLRRADEREHDRREPDRRGPDVILHGRAPPGATANVRVGIRVD
jgi:hypothetical protein